MSHFRTAFPTLFRPIETPKNPVSGEEEAVLKCVEEFLHDVADGWNNAFPPGALQGSLQACVDRARQLASSFVALHGGRALLSAPRICQSIRELQVGGYWGMRCIALLHRCTTPPHLTRVRQESTESITNYLHCRLAAQNAVVLFFRRDDNTGDVFVWECQQPKDVIMGCTAAVRQMCPRAGTRVPWERLITTATSELLFELATQTPERAFPKARKAGEQVKESRDVPDPMYALEVFLLQLGGRVLDLAGEIGGVHKKACDTIAYANGELPWRRNGVWLALKSLLHVAFVRQGVEPSGGSVGSSSRACEAHVLYKVFVQNFLALCLQRAVVGATGLSGGTAVGVVTDSGVVEARNKLVRRLSKLPDQEPLLLRETFSCGPLSSSVRNVFEGSKKFCVSAVQRSLAPARRRWEELTRSASRCEIPACELNPDRDIVHKLETSDAVLCALVAEREGYFLRNTTVAVADPRSSSRLRFRRSLFSSSNAPTSCSSSNVKVMSDRLRHAFSTRWKTEPHEVLGALCDIREGAFGDFQRLRSSPAALRSAAAKAKTVAPQLLALFREYMQVALQVFQSDARGSGEAVLVGVSLVLLCDLIACEAHPLLKEHRLGFEPGLLAALWKIFVSTAVLKEHLHLVEKYVEERRRSGRKPATIEPNRSGDSFSVRFAQRDPDMRQTLMEIHLECQQSQERKREELRSNQTLYEHLMSYHLQHTCSCRWVGFYPNSRYETCIRCSKKKQADNIKMSYYEKLLPPSDHGQLAVVFELRQPVCLVVQRDIVFQFLEQVCGEEWCSETDRYLWSSEGRLSKWRVAFANECVFRKTDLGSVRKKWSQSHYNHRDHVTQPDFHDFIVPHDYNVELMGPSGKVKASFKWDVTRLCSVTLPQQSSYKNLERFFNGHDHDENQVVAEKSEASREVSLTEFEKAGTLRAGPRHQLVRLASALQQRDLAFEREEIVSLVSAALWQAGPGGEAHRHQMVVHNPSDVQLGDDDVWFRQNAELLRKPDFVVELCEKLGSVLDGCSENWSCQNILLNVIHIARTVAEHSRAESASSSLQGRAALERVLRRCREIAYKWALQLEERSNRCGKDAEMQKLRKRTADVAVMGTLTFLSRERSLLRDAEDVAKWMFFRAKFNDNVSPAEVLEPSWRRQHLLHAYVVAEDVAEDVADFLSVSTAGMDGHHGLTRFLSLYWSAAEGGSVQGSWQRYVHAPHWYHAKFSRTAAGAGTSCVIQVNVVSGVFLVDGAPCKSLPREITSHEIYRRLFGTSIFAVQPSGTGGYRTSMPIGGFVYEFHACPNHEQFASGAPIIVKEAFGRRAVLLPDSLFQGDLPELLVEDYSHWFDLFSAEVFFRPVRYFNTEFFPGTGTGIASSEDFLAAYRRTSDYVLYGESRSVFSRVTGRFLIDVRSSTFNSMWLRAFHRLASRLSVHVFDSRATGGNIHIELPKLQNLRFELSQTDRAIFSVDFKGYRIAAEQNFGTLVGLQHGVLMEGPSDAHNQVFLCPHGAARRTTKEGAVAIDVSRLREPAFFKYELRPELQDVRASSTDRLASLYLAHLHQITSGVFPDPFTNTTGTSRAFEILRSARCCGNLINSLDEDRLKTPLLREGTMLHEIACVSPCRANYHFMEMNNVDRLTHHALCAHPGFVFLADLRISDLDRALRLIGKGSALEILGDGKQKEDFGRRMADLSKRAYFQHRERYTKDVVLSAEEEEVFGESRSMLAPIMPATPAFAAARASMWEIGRAAHNPADKVNQRASITDLLCGRGVAVLVGVTTTPAALSGVVAGIFQAIAIVGPSPGTKRDFRDVWLNLYHLARHGVIAGNIADKRAAFGFLLTWMASEFPEEKRHLHQLAIVMEHPGEFPASSSIASSYEKPHEQEFLSHHVDDLLEGHLKIFTEDRPYYDFSDLDRAIREWQDRRDDHREKRAAAKSELLQQARQLWGGGNRTSGVNLFDSLLNSPSSFSQELSKLFKRWSAAIALQDFINGVSAQLSVYQSRLPASIPTQTRDHVGAARDFRGGQLPRPYTVATSRELRCDLPASPSLVADVSRMFEGCKCKWDFSGTETGGTVPRSTVGSSFSFHDFKESFLENVCSEQYKELSEEMLGHLERSWNLAQRGGDSDFSALERQRDVLWNELESYERVAKSVLQRVWDVLSQNLSEEEAREGIETGFWDSVTPVAVLRRFFAEKIGSVYDGGAVVGSEGGRLSPFVLSYAFVLKHVQRARRCKRLLLQGDSARMHLLKELANVGCEGWTPQEYPEWLLLEVDNDFGIRANQAQVAKAMLPEDGIVPSSLHDLSNENRLMQMTMGDGKTAVIVPMVLVRTARGGRSLVRVTVLSSLYATNAADWQHKLGGLLGRKVYPMLCRRDLRIGLSEAQAMEALCECIRHGNHVVVTVPEHRLSLENKALELASTESLHSDPAASHALHRVLDIFNKHGRDFLDESDEILSPKYQLVYTLGAQQDFDGGRLRWAVHAATFEALAHHAEALQNEFSSSTVELLFGGDVAHGRRGTEYPGLRLLEAGRPNAAYAKIMELVLDFILSGATDLKIKLTARELDLFTACVRGRGTGADVRCLPVEMRVLALTLRGVLAQGVLQLVLAKRWRVHYGAHPSSGSYLMAVPYRAKDVAADRTEFGHPDMMLMLTYAHYYQQGLSEQQLREVFDCLKRLSESEAKALYRRWVSGLDSQQVNLDGIASYEGVNMEDGGLFRDRLFPIFRKHMKVVQFWLVKKVFPVQAKQFPKKLVATAPDLCRSAKLGRAYRSLSTGFSGTDDLKVLLPPTIRQENLDALEAINGQQLLAVCRDENDDYATLSGENSAQEILGLLQQGRRARVGGAERNGGFSSGAAGQQQEGQLLNVMLDPGGLVLELGNRLFVEEWLKVRPDMEAGAYFEGDAIKVVKRCGGVLPFHVSPYADDMSKCLLYLDDIHTRGSDFRLPLRTRALLTLGKGLTKDKLLQACMRLRQLGAGQSLTFAASREVDLVLRSEFRLDRVRLTPLGVVSVILQWALRNTVQRICDLMPYFVGQARACMRKAYAYNVLYHGRQDRSAEELQRLAAACVEDELMAVEDLYGHARAKDTLPNIIRRQLEDRQIFAAGQEDPALLPAHRTSSETTSFFGEDQDVELQDAGEDPVSSSLDLSSTNGNAVALMRTVADAIKNRIGRLAPRVGRHCSMFDEEQERELEQELEEETQCERPPPARPWAPAVSEELAAAVPSSPEAMRNYLGARHLFQPLSAMFQNTSLELFMTEQLADCRVFATTDFLRTVHGSGAKDAHVKNIRWLLRIGAEGSASSLLVVISNFEAEAFAQLMSCSRSSWCRLFPFAGITRLQQPTEFLQAFGSVSVPPVVHVLAGSVHAEGALLEEIRAFLGLHPRPLGRCDAEEWDGLFSQGYIERDGFVCIPNRTRVVACLHGVEYLDRFSFRTSPVHCLLSFFSNIRNLGNELAISSVGQLLGASDHDMERYANHDSTAMEVETF